MYLTYHSYGQYVLYGWGYERAYPPNKDQLHDMGNVAAQAMHKINGGTSYTVGGAAVLLNAAAGLFIATHQLTSTDTLLHIYNISAVCKKLNCQNISLGS